MPYLDIAQEMIATQLGVCRLTVSELLHEKRGLTSEMAVRISKVMGVSHESWLRMEPALDILSTEIKFSDNLSIPPTALV